MNNHIICPVCRGKSFKPIPPLKDHHIVKCLSCGFSFSDKIPTKEELTNYYGRYNRNRHVSDLTIKRYHELLDNFELEKQTGNILDVGCGSGFFLIEALKRDWNTFGTEYGFEAIEHLNSKGIIAKDGAIEHVSFPKESFDVITSFEVIEHLSSPKPHAKRIYELLRPGGIFYVTTPNFNSITRRILQAESTIVAYPEHLSYFSPKSLNKLLTDLGFQCKRMEAVGINIDGIRNAFQNQKVSLENLNPKENPDTPLVTNESVRKLAENNPIMRLARKFVDKSLNSLDSGEFIKAWYIKPKDSKLPIN